MCNSSISPPVNLSNNNTSTYELPSTCNFTLDNVQLALNSLKNNNFNGSDGNSARLLCNYQDYCLLFIPTLWMSVFFLLYGRPVLLFLFLNLAIPRFFLTTGLYPSSLTLYFVCTKCIID